MPDDVDYIIIALGAFMALLIVSYIPGTVATMFNTQIKSTGCNKCNKSQSNTLSNKQITLDTIQGIDLKSLQILRNRGY